MYDDWEAKLKSSLDMHNLILIPKKDTSYFFKKSNYLKFDQSYTKIKLLASMIQNKNH